jgi:hypothetical protein
MGCYLRDYTLRSGVPMDMLKHQWERVLARVQDGTLAGYSILAAVLIERGYPVTVVDFRKGPQAVLATVHKHRPLVIGFS